MSANLSEIPEIEVSYSKNRRWHRAIQLTASSETYDVLMNNWNVNTIELLEEFKVIYLDNANQVLWLRNLTRWNSKSTVIDYKLIFAIGLKCNAGGIIVSHNHPSGRLHPSRQDIWLTQRIKEIGELLDIKLLDHLIVSDLGYYSFANEGML